jgi:starvation-inducible DNA-binding protein
MPSRNRYTVPGMKLTDGAAVAEILQLRLHSLNDLALTLKHVHWNVVGPHFIAVHEMLDPQIDDVRAFVDQIAERIATLGGEVVGTPGALVAARDWDDYAIGRDDAIAHLGALDQVYQGVIAAHRQAAADVEDSDPVSNDMLIGHLHSLELFHWFVRAHLESPSGALTDAAAATEKQAAKKVATRTGSRRKS